MTTELTVHNYKDVERQEWLIGHPHSRLPVPPTAPEEQLRIQQADDAQGKVANHDAYEAAVLASKGL